MRWFRLQSSTTSTLLNMRSEVYHHWPQHVELSGWIATIRFEQKHEMRRSRTSIVIWGQAKNLWDTVSCYKACGLV